VLVRGRPELLAIAGVAGILAAVTLGRPVFAAIGGAVVAAGLLLARRRDGRARGLAGTLNAALDAEPASRRFREFAAPIAGAARVRWVGLVRWHQDVLSGSIGEELSLGGDTPSEDALTSWLLRDGEGADGLVGGPVAELEGAGTYLAVPARRDGATVGYVVVLFSAAPPRHLQLALAAAAPRVARLLREPEPKLTLAAAEAVR